MRIIKGVQDVFATIAGEMLNIETSSLHFLNGIPLKVGTEVSSEDYRGYPKIVAGSVVHIIRGSSGYIFVPIGTNMIEFQEKLIAAILELESTMTRPDGSDHNVLKQYHTVKCNYNTNIKVKSALSVTQGSNAPKPAPIRYGARNAAVTNNLKRIFVVDPENDSRRGRFTWFLKTFDEIEQEITSDNMDDSVARFACSILHDRDDICKLEHNQTTFEFSKEFLKGYDNIVDENITLFKHGNPLLFELSEHWRTAHVETTAVSFLRNINENKVYEADHAALKFKPVHIADSTGESSTDICSQCRSLLVGDNYALAGNVKNPGSDMCVAICALCLHSSPEDKPVEAKYFRVFRVTFPRRVEDLVDALTVSDQRKELRREALKRVESKKLYVDEKNVSYIMIGNKYAAFASVDDFLYTKLSVHPDFANRKVCNATLVE
jgi:hypothetical protein